MQDNEAVAFYIVAHQDDWQLFMSPNAYTDLNDPSHKIIFVYTTAGDAGKDEQYWSAREKGALESVRMVLDTAKSPREEAVCSEKSYHGHDIHCCQYKGTSAYFLRLPDGCMTGKGSVKHQHQSLSKLRKGEVQKITAVDGTVTYHGWDDLCQTIAAIIKSESEGRRNVWIHTSDFLLADNFIDNADHTATGRLVHDAVKHLGIHHGITLYRDYDVDLLPPNLTPQQVHQKTSLFIAYDLKVQAEVGHCTRCESRYYSGWCLRQYTRQIQKGHPSTVAGKLWAHTLMHFTRFRKWQGAKPEAIAQH
ncbi:MAG TPA: PIG-L family deacetylase [Aggregatilineales bacterium]|nr:PIG-L family deacetylase [Aggregatilineales bacterium]